MHSDLNLMMITNAFIESNYCKKKMLYDFFYFILYIHLFSVCHFVHLIIYPSIYSLIFLLIYSCMYLFIYQCLPITSAKQMPSDQP